jgi:hypothetical protein
MKNRRKSPSTFAEYFQILFTAMQQSVYITMPEAGKNGRQINRADRKVSRNTIQFRLSGILFATANSKLCFELLTSFSAAQNHLYK